MNGREWLLSSDRAGDRVPMEVAGITFWRVVEVGRDSSVRVVWASQDPGPFIRHKLSDPIEVPSSWLVSPPFMGALEEVYRRRKLVPLPLARGETSVASVIPFIVSGITFWRCELMSASGATRTEWFGDRSFYEPGRGVDMTQALGYGEEGDRIGVKLAIVLEALWGRMVGRESFGGGGV